MAPGVLYREFFVSGSVKAVKQSLFHSLSSHRIIFTQNDLFVGGINTTSVHTRHLMFYNSRASMLFVHRQLLPHYINSDPTQGVLHDCSLFFYYSSYKYINRFPHISVFTQISSRLLLMHTLSLALSLSLHYSCHQKMFHLFNDLLCVCVCVLHYYQDECAAFSGCESGCSTFNQYPICLTGANKTVPVKQTETCCQSRRERVFLAQLSSA